MKTVKFLKAKTYGGKRFKVGETFPMREDHANLLQQIGVVVIENSPVVKLPIPVSYAETRIADSIPMADIEKPKRGRPFQKKVYGHGV